MCACGASGRPRPCPDVGKRTLHTLSDNQATVAWVRRGSVSLDSAAGYLLRYLALHHREHRYLARLSYIPGPANAMADAASRRWDLTHAQFLTFFNSCYPQDLTWELHPLSAPTFSHLLCALHKKRSAAAIPRSRALAHDAHFSRWARFRAQHGLAPWLDPTDPHTIPWLQTYAALQRSGQSAARNQPLRAKSICDVLAAIAQAHTHLGRPDPRHTSSGKLDPRHLSLPNCAATPNKNPLPAGSNLSPCPSSSSPMPSARQTNTPESAATADLMWLAYFFLLRPGEYTLDPDR